MNQYPDYALRIVLQSDTAPGRGDGVAGDVDAEIDHDKQGLPYLHGRTLKGLLTAQCAEVLGALQQQSPSLFEIWAAVADTLFGVQGGLTYGQSGLKIGHACLPIDLQHALSQASFKPSEVLAALTSIRRQTRVDSETGAAADKSLRATRVIQRGLEFNAPLSFSVEPNPQRVGLLAACAASLRHIGMNRTRGLGRVSILLVTPEATSMPDLMVQFEREVRACLV